MPKSTKNTELKTESKTDSKVTEQTVETKPLEKKTKSSKKDSKQTEQTEQTVQVVQTEQSEKKTEASTPNNEQSASGSENQNELKFNSQLHSTMEEVKALKEALGGLTMSLRKLESAYNTDMKKMKKTKPKREKPHVPTGFNKAKPVPEKLAKFLGVNPGTELSGPQVTKKVWAILKEKELTYEKDKRVFRTDAEISKLFNVPKSVNNSTYHKDKMGFNFCNLQKYIANALK